MSETKKNLLVCIIFFQMAEGILIKPSLTEFAGEVMQQERLD